MEKEVKSLTLSTGEGAKPKVRQKRWAAGPAPPAGTEATGEARSELTLLQLSPLQMASVRLSTVRSAEKEAGVWRN